MATPTRIRAKITGDKTDVRVLMTHPMESGLRKTAAGQPIPAKFITEVSATLNGSRTLLAARWSAAVSQDPFVAFRFGGGKAGDKLVVTWKDNTGESRADEVVLA